MYTQAVPCECMVYRARLRTVFSAFDSIPFTAALTIKKTSSSFQWSAPARAMYIRGYTRGPVACGTDGRPGALLLLEDPIDVRGVLLVAGLRAQYIQAVTLVHVAYACMAEGCSRLRR